MSSEKEELTCDICNVKFDCVPNLEVHYAEKKHAAYNSSSVKKVECESVARDEETELEMLTSEGKKKCREENEVEVILECNAAASDVADKDDEQANQLRISHAPDALLTEKHGGGQCEKQMHCELCNVVCSGRAALDAHLVGKKHAQMLKRSITKDATPCSGVFESSNSYAANGGRKKRFRADTDGKDFLLHEPSNDAASNGPVKRVRAEDCVRCEICSVECTSKRDLEVHSAGRKHAACLMKLLRRDATAGVGIAGSGNIIVGSGVKEDQISASHGSEGNVVEWSNDSGLVGKLVTKEGGLTGDDSFNIAIEGCSVGKQHADGLEISLAKGGPDCNVKASDVHAGEFVCAGTTVLDTLAGLNTCEVIERCNIQVSDGSEVKLASGNGKTHVLYELCSTDCESSMEGHVIVKMHATCLLRLLIMDKNACTGKAGAMLRCSLDRLGRDETLQKTSLCSPPTQPVSALKSEEMDCEERECKLCLVKCSSKTDLDTHLAGKRHATQLRKLLGRCELCNVYCGTSKILESHIAGRKHTSKLRLMQTMGDLEVDDVPPPVRQDSDGKA